MTEASSWFAAVKRLNTDYCDRSIEFERLNSLSSPPTKLEKVLESLYTRTEPWDEQQRDVPTPPRIFQHSDDHIRHEFVESDLIMSDSIRFNQFPHKSVESDRFQSQLPTSERPTPIMSPRSLIKYPYHREQRPEFDVTEPSPESTNRSSDNTVLPQNTNDDRAFLANLITRTDAYSALSCTPRNPNSPCFAHFYNNCPGNCGRSHADEHMLDFRDREFKKFINSPYVTLDWLQNGVNQMQEPPFPDNR